MVLRMEGTVEENPVLCQVEAKFSIGSCAVGLSRGELFQFFRIIAGKEFYAITVVVGLISYHFGTLAFILALTLRKPPSVKGGV